MTASDAPPANDGSSQSPRLTGQSGAPSPLIQYSFARTHGILVLSDDDQPRIGVRENADLSRLAEIRRVLGRPLRVENLDAKSFDHLLAEIYGREGLAGASSAEHLEQHSDLDSLVDEMPKAADLLDTQDDAPIIRLINAILADAVRRGASDIHIEPFEQSLIVRLRLDGVMREVLNLPARLAPLLVSRVKVMARLDIAERRVPQDGRMAVALGGKTLDVRVSTLPVLSGERVVLRVLDREQANLQLSALGMGADLLQTFRASLKDPNGMILVTGPTGSGKTTTLYAGLAVLNNREQTILTIEDPVEYAIDGVGQTQVNSKVGMTFAAGLRAILRQNPNVIMVGEIRDVETAHFAVHVSLTGHLVLSTVHTNDAVGAITRLRDMGVEPFLLASTLRLIVAQRLVRRLCPHCARTEPADWVTAKALGIAEGATIWRAVGCNQCGATGYRGRVGVYEAIRITDPIRQMIAENADEARISAAAFANEPQLSSAVRTYVLEGVTTPEEAFRVVRQTEDLDAGL